MSGLCTYRAGAGVSPDFRWFLPCRWSFEVNTSIVLRMNPLHLVSWFLKWIKTTLRPLNPDFFILRNCIQGFDHWIHSLAVPHRHLCDTYLKGKNSIHWLTGLKSVSIHTSAWIKKDTALHQDSFSISILKLLRTHAFYVGDTHHSHNSKKPVFAQCTKNPEKERQKKSKHKTHTFTFFCTMCSYQQCHFFLQPSHWYPQVVLISICLKLEETKFK